LPAVFEHMKHRNGQLKTAIIPWSISPRLAAGFLSANALIGF